MELRAIIESARRDRKSVLDEERWSGRPGWRTLRLPVVEHYAIGAFRIT
jgi:hypothetical protein